MSELLASSGGPGSAGHPDLEELAALVDGRLPALLAGRVRTHLADCEECYEVFAETLHLQEELREDDASGEVFTFPREVPRQVWPQWAAAAAILVVVFGAGLWRGFAPHRPEGSLRVADLARAAGRQDNLDAATWGEKTLGGGDSENSTAAFRAGVESLNLQIALLQQDQQSADRAAATLYGLLHPLPRAQVEEKYLLFYPRVREACKMEAVPDFGRLATAAAKQGEALRGLKSLGPTDFDLGAFAAAARFAALNRKPDLFLGGAARSLRAELEEDKDFKVSPEVSNALKEIERACTKTPRTAEDYAGLRRASEQILEAYYPRVGA
jgi:hypothetical protein